LLHVPAHVLPAHAYGAHASVVGTHAAELHAYVVCVPDAHAVCPQLVPFVSVHVPAPWQVSASHVAVFAAQTACGSFPMGTFVHVPTEPARLHALHPVQVASGVSQQTVSTQLPMAHDALLAHVAPSTDCAAHFIVGAQ
jgi:hypothetical protein